MDELGIHLLSATLKLQNCHLGPKPEEEFGGIQLPLLVLVFYSFPHLRIVLDGGGTLESRG